VNADKLDVVPEPTDVFTYDPAVVQPYPLDKKKDFNFLTIMKWEKRKGWDTLLNAYFEEFSAEEDVSLYVRSSLDQGNKDEYEKFVKDFLQKSGISLNLSMRIDYFHQVE
jgi:hypothetical protein